jgi:hypothetical protein
METPFLFFNSLAQTRGKIRVERCTETNIRGFVDESKNLKQNYFHNGLNVVQGKSQGNGKSDFSFTPSFFYYWRFE